MKPKAECSPLTIIWWWAVSSEGDLNLKSIAKSASEIKKYADRLKYNLMLPEPEKDDKRPKAELATEHKQLMSSLLTLNQKIIGFVNNPMFKDANVLDAKNVSNALRDLDWIIETEQQRQEKAARS
ncbi:MAG: hypothetical protein WKF84_00970 [Pyrinomonadaceae bacterium]